MSSGLFGTRRLVVVGVALAMLAVGATPAVAQQAKLQGWALEGTITVHGNTLALPHGTADGTLDLDTGALTTQMHLLPVSAHVTVPNAVGGADLTLSLEEAAPLKGQAGFTGSNVVLAASPAFFLHVQSAKATLVPVLNFTSAACRSVVPFALPLQYSGPLDFTKGFTFAGTVTLPTFDQCGVAASRLNDTLSGNATFTARLVPGPNSPDPLAGATPTDPGTGTPPGTDPGTDPGLDPGTDPALVDPGAFEDPGAGLPDLSSILGLLSDTQAPTLDVKVSRSQRVLSLGGAKVTAGCDEQCLLTAKGSLVIGRKTFKLVNASGVIRPGATKALKVRLSTAARTPLRAALKKRKAASVRLTLSATDVAGNRSTSSRATVKVVR